MQRFLSYRILAVATFCLFAGACAKKQVVAAAPAAPVAPAPAPAPVVAPTPPRPATPAQPAAPPTAARYPDAATRARIDELIGRIQDAYFDYNQHTLRPDAVRTLDADSKELATIMNQYPTYKLQIEGYCDERGSAEYNIALGDARAKAAKDYLVSVGVSPNQLDTVSYGKENPVCSEHTQGCWQKNRRIHIVAEKTNG
ncbi:MAG TPA: OmpA family protein [Bryobacteraceae bacterium]|jgi:peptidoglycan-associated lipoprotein|nr:OmpA family protein [Bryobacteraceae bacterium]